MIQIQIEISACHHQIVYGAIWVNGQVVPVTMPMDSYLLLKEKGLFLRQGEDDIWPDDNGVLNETPVFTALALQEAE